jgi:hypothetical protein
MSRVFTATRFVVRQLCSVLVAVCVAGLGTAASAAVPQRSFPTADDAVSALVQALKGEDKAALLAVIGESARPWITSGDDVADRASRENFLRRFDEKHAVVSGADGKSILTLGADEWPFAFPLVQSKAGWRFDTEAGRTELLARRIGENELAVVDVLQAIVDAQREYASSDRDGSGVRQYAAKLASSDGKRDGLYWKTAAGEPESPLGPLVTRAAAEGYRKGQGGPQPYHGYVFRVLKSQGPNAKGGKLDYVAKGRMIGGFAAIAYPARYGNSGVMTFIVNHDGVVFERDLGKDTAQRAARITSFDPGPGWTPVKTD